MTRTLSAGEHRQMLRFQETLRVALSAEVAERSGRDITASSPFGAERAWVGYERRLMHRVVNLERTRLGFGEVDEAEVYEVEQSAAGHSDYAAKYTLRLAKLAYGVEWR